MCGSGWLLGAVRVLWTRVMVWLLWARSVALVRSALGGGSLGLSGTHAWLCGERKSDMFLQLACQTKEGACVRGTSTGTVRAPARVSAATGGFRSYNRAHTHQPTRARPMGPGTPDTTRRTTDAGRV